MSDGVLNFPKRLTHPDAPSADRVKFYIFNNEPYYKLDNGLESTLKGDQGTQGPQGIQGVQGPIGLTGSQGIQGIQGIQGPIGLTGPQGIQGPVGPVECSFILTDTSTITLPNVSTLTSVRLFNLNITQAGRYIATTSLAFSPHATNNDMIFQWRLSSADVGPEYREEHQELGNTQNHIRSWQFDLGNLSVGTSFLDLYFRKETVGGTATLKYISVFVWRVS